MRRTPRARAPVQIVDLDAPGSPPLVARDIAVSGTFVTGAPPWQPGLVRHLRIESGGERVSVEAQVVRATPEGVAVSFCELSSETRRELEQLVLSLFTRGAEIDEQRRAPRLPIGEAAAYAGKAGQRPCRVEDLSLSGARLSAVECPQQGEQIRLFLAVEGTAGTSELGAYSSTALVVRVTPTAFAVRFLDASAEFRAAVSAVRTSSRRRRGA